MDGYQADYSGYENQQYGYGSQGLNGGCSGLNGGCGLNGGGGYGGKGGGGYGGSVVGGGGKGGGAMGSSLRMVAPASGGLNEAPRGYGAGGLNSPRVGAGGPMGGPMGSHYGGGMGMAAQAYPGMGAQGMGAYGPHAGSGVLPMPDDPDVFQVHMVIPDRLSGGVMGKQGATIRAIQENSGCHKVSANTRERGVDRKIVCIGNYQQLSSAQMAVHQACVEACAGSSINPESLNNATSIMWVPKEVCGAVIGKGGANLTRVRDQTGVKVSFAKEDVRGLRPCSVIGQLSNVISAQGMLCEVIAEERRTNPPVKRTTDGLDGGMGQGDPKRARTGPIGGGLVGGGVIGGGCGGYGGGKGGFGMGAGMPAGGKGFGAAAGMQVANSTFTKMLIPAAAVSAVIGTKGAGLAQIREECGVRVEVPKREETPQFYQDRVVLLHGPPANRQSAAQAVLSAAYGNAGPEVVAKLQILVGDADVGKVIGKAGSTVKQLREQSGQNVQVEKNMGMGERLVRVEGPLGPLTSLAHSIVGLSCGEEGGMGMAPSNGLTGA